VLIAPRWVFLFITAPRLNQRKRRTLVFQPPLVGWTIFGAGSSHVLSWLIIPVPKAREMLIFSKKSRSGENTATFMQPGRIGPSKLFPPVKTANAQGLLMVGGNLSVEMLLDAYCHGIFPWPSGNILAWWCPDPRAVLDFDDLHVSRRLMRTLKSDKFAVTCDRDFAGVIRCCATVQHRWRGTWITSPLRAAYERLHRLGYAHSVEVWQGEALVGGIYGVALGGMFAGESMFYQVADASKVALVHLVRHLQARGYELFDIQQLTPHTARMGAKEIPRKAFLARLAEALEKRVTFGDKLAGSEALQGFSTNPKTLE
jgi:leucyl/phenylalanyl-tRNA--protein transferase